MSRARILVAGAGASGLAAAISAHEAGADVVVVEKGERGQAGGNARFSGGLFLFAYDRLEDLIGLVEMPPIEVDVEPYCGQQFEEAMMAMSGGRADPELVSALVGDSLDAMRWLRRHGVRFRFASGVFGPYERDGRLVVPAGPVLESQDAGPGLVEALVAEVERREIPLHFTTALEELRVEDGHVTGAFVHGDRICWDWEGVILTTGGFEASPSLRARHLGEAWRSATYRGTPHNTGELLEVALSHGAAAAGDWGECHSISVDAGAPGPARPGDATPARLSRGFRFGLVVNAEGKRFFDEGADTWTRIYSKMGRAIMAQPGAVAFHLFDDQVREQVDAAIQGVDPLVADRLDELAARAGVSAEGLTETVDAFNAAIGDEPLDFDVLDGRRTHGVSPPKSNWATPIEQPPFRIYRAACGITFTHGGLRIDPDGRVLGRDGRPIAGLYAAGEMTGGFFFGNYPGGSSLMRSTVFGRRAGAAAVAGRR